MLFLNFCCPLSLSLCLSLSVSLSLSVTLSPSLSLSLPSDSEEEEGSEGDSGLCHSGRQGDLQHNEDGQIGQGRDKQSRRAIRDGATS